MNIQIPIYSYFQELKWRLIYLLLGFLVYFLILYKYKDTLLILASKSLLQLNNNFIYTNLTDLVFLEIKFSLIIAFLITLIYAFGHMFFFFLPGLYKQEVLKLTFLLVYFGCLSFFLFLCLYTYILPLLWNFFLSFTEFSKIEVIKIRLEPKIDTYIELWLQIVTFFIFLSLIPFFLYIITLASDKNLQYFVKYRFTTYLGVLFVVLFFGAPEIYMQFLFFLTILLFYELALLAVKVVFLYYRLLWKRSDLNR